MWLFYSISFSLGLLLVSLWNMNHVFGWFESLDSLYGIGIGLMILAGTYYVYRDIAKKVWYKQIISGFFLYLAIANLTDELFFDPFVVSIKEYLTALITLIIITYATRARVD